MELRQLEYFMAVCEELHFTKAADKIGISQPNLSLSIKALEEEIGMPLFDRIGKRIQLTDAGSILKKHARMMLQNLSNALQEMDDLYHQNGGNLSIGALPSELDYRLTPMFIRFFQRYPNIRLKIISEVDVTGMVLNTDMHIGIAVKPLFDPRLVIRPLAREEYGIVVSKNHELSKAESISLADLQFLPIVMYPKGLWGREFVDSWCRQHGFHLNVVVETSSNPSLFYFVKANIGVGIVANSLLESIDSLDLRFLPIRDYPPVREMSIIYRSDKYLSHAARTFIHFAEEQLKDR
ncbi:LysR family transcriptional regulator [Paenibacillus aceris]|uniref:DNA-binding transcriptional LysR family regulator n=1 Tax=Paenibacillus aceris TaxID=869555 RepID=A0ABS4HZM2_9BACL|nr:LysR family transcriptional regulator [Paenibacillus aceris]MBP1964113.1 DNA-binding transcriptional LysR family regulator [Paenibacillus aceris]NHW36447.1 LysR family transcriptional regulator [Paenibacillus aceris]